MCGANCRVYGARVKKNMKCKSGCPFFKKLVAMEKAGSYIASHRIGVWWMCLFGGWCVGVSFCGHDNLSAVVQLSFP